MIVARLLLPCSKLATTRHWRATTLAGELGVADADEDELYEALDWLLERQERIEGKLARLQLEEGALARYDVSSSYYEGRACPLVRYGHNRDGKKDKPIVVYGVLTDRRDARYPSSSIPARPAIQPPCRIRWRSCATVSVFPASRWWGTSGC